MLKQNTWRFIIGRCNIKQYLSSSRSLEIESQLRDDQLPEIEIKTVREFICNLAAGAPDLLMEFISEIFNLLRPPNSKYKTNTEYEIKEKAILNYIIDNNYGFITLSYSITNDLKRRLKEHRSNRSKGSQILGNFILLHTEEYADHKTARKREKFLKSGHGRVWLNEFESQSRSPPKAGTLRRRVNSYSLREVYAPLAHSNGNG